MAEAGSGRGWEDAPYTEAIRDALVQKIGEQQRRVAAAATSGLGGRMDRGQHQKLLLGAVGTLRVFEEIPALVKVGPFVAPFALPVACRFSNGQPCPFSDKTPDVRGVALKFFTPLGTETDILATNEGGRSHARDAESFMAFADILVAKIERGATSAVEEAFKELREGKLTPGEIVHMGAVILKEAGLHTVRSLAQESYWGSVLNLGGVAFKYSLQAHQDTPAAAEPDREDPDYLRHELLGRLAKAPVTWRLCVQTFVDEGSTPVNDASKAWAGDSVVVGELEISSAPSVEDERKINQMAFNPGHGFDPLGITHARADVYAASARNRADRGLLSSKETREFLAARR